MLDFSPHSETLLKLAEKWGQLLDAQLILVHQLTVMVPAMTDLETRSQIIQNERAIALEKLRALVSENITAPLTIIYEVSEVKLSLTLHDLLKMNYLNLVMLGLKDSGFFRKLFIGSTFTKVMEEINCLTVAVPESLNNLSPENLVVALHYKFPLNKPALTNFLNLLKTNIRALEFISVNNSGTEEETAENNQYIARQSAEYGRDYPVTLKIFNGSEVSAEISGHVKSHHPDAFLVLQKGPRSFIDKIARSFTIDSLLEEGSIPLIILPEIPEPHEA